MLTEVTDLADSDGVWRNRGVIDQPLKTIGL